jgi:hypothetical protein
LGKKKALKDNNTVFRIIYVICHMSYVIGVSPALLRRAGVETEAEADAEAEAEADAFPEPEAEAEAESFAEDVGVIVGVEVLEGME